MSVLRNKFLNKIFKLKTEVVIKNWMKLCKEKLYKFYPLPKILRIIELDETCNTWSRGEMSTKP
jgi:hypothetical protein